MPTPTYVALAKTVLTGTQATVTFSSIPSTYTDLVLLISARGDYSGFGVDMKLQLNSIASGYSDTVLYAQTTTPASFRDTAMSTAYVWFGMNGSTATSNTFTNYEIYIPNYAGSTNKVLSQTGVVENNSSSSNLWALLATASLSNNTSAISSFVLTPQNGNFVSGSRFDLYGIKNS